MLIACLDVFCLLMQRIEFFWSNLVLFFIYLSMLSNLCTIVFVSCYFNLVNCIFWYRWATRVHLFASQLQKWNQILLLSQLWWVALFSFVCVNFGSPAQAFYVGSVDWSSRFKYILTEVNNACFNNLPSLCLHVLELLVEH